MSVHRPVHDVYARAAGAIAVSLCPEEALSYLARIYNTLVVFEPPEILFGYADRLIIHSLGFPDQAPVRLLCDQLLQEFGFCPDTFPALAIQGLATIASIFEYDADRFEDDCAAHGYKDPLHVCQREWGRVGMPAWGIKLADTYFLNTPLYDILPPPKVGNGGFWLPQSPAQLRSFDVALKRDMEEVFLGGEIGSEDA
ncbi:hypothetical protein Pse7367_2922 [Thalassoporum mexicanum PCC 7367]|uniref:hypothetical protein n=1 Tax=Thalassoporum mexicanum TaxID=3457544 RepID=UPI00029F843C|nr:hypothetical protein [Pseudanabaena sp. PCC 7367]AFY71175.1 hypothetical protein Pse7367_2922 [Pseudanabaena sp. PCC 7367]